ncbi:hypothetical protein [Mycoplasmopsis cynos]|uniref:hypothetical protein n=1 Tax=Mycoplasmopsis cynos TaxID=171284 RepID=UPI0025464BFB|nr:hypothetical protein [Mycoplasmopsis cynos]
MVQKHLLQLNQEVFDMNLKNMIMATNINSHYGKQQSDYGNNRVFEEKLQLNLENLIVIINDMLVNSFELDLITLVNQLLDVEKSDDGPKSSYFGIVDTILGFPKMDYYLYQSQWLDVKEHPMVKIAPHWAWDDKTKRDFVIKNGKITLRIYSNARKIPS